MPIRNPPAGTIRINHPDVPLYVRGKSENPSRLHLQDEEVLAATSTEVADSVQLPTQFQALQNPVCGKRCPFPVKFERLEITHDVPNPSAIIYVACRNHQGKRRG